MCGIVAYLGKQPAYPILLKGLKRLEYRGYDSAGIALLNGKLNVYKKKGKVASLEKYANQQVLDGHIGIGHTRWATHGKPDDNNAHPHLSNSGRLVLVHNGIIENYAVLKKILHLKGYQFHSETDTEVLVNFIEAIQDIEQVSLEEAVRIALTKVTGAYAIVVMDKTKPDTLVAARLSSPLVIGIGEKEFYIASDATPIIEYTNKVVYINDQEVVTLNGDGRMDIKSLDNEIQTPVIQEIDLQIEMLEKGGYDYYMHKEIHEQPTTIEACMRGRLNADEGWLKLDGLEKMADQLMNAKRFIIVSCGTSWHAGLIGEYLFEDLLRIPVEVEYASEFRYRNPVITKEDVVFAISQSGETADTLAAIQLAKEKGATIYGVVNVVGSSIARATDGGCYIHAGPEIGVASTKAFTGQVTLLSMLAVALAKKKESITASYYQSLITELYQIPKKIQSILDTENHILSIAKEIKDATNALYLGRGYNFPVALEGALKLKEISYIHADGYPAAEMKHGPIALIDEQMPVVVVATNKSAYEKIISNIQEVKARGGIVIAIVTQGEKEIQQLADFSIEIPETMEVLTPLLSVIPLQLLSYHVAVMRGCDVDQPKNLAKSVTVE